MMITDIPPVIIAASMGGCAGMLSVIIFNHSIIQRFKVKIENLEQSLRSAETSLRITEKISAAGEKKVRDTKERTIKAKDAVIRSLNEFCKAADITGADITAWQDKVEKENLLARQQMAAKQNAQILQQASLDCWPNGFLTGFYDAQNKG